MNDWKRITVNSDASIRDALKVINNAGSQFIIVLSNEGKLLGSVTDGDVRRGILSDIPLSASVTQVMNVTPLTLPSTVSHKKALEFLVESKISHVPLVNKDNIVTGIVGLLDNENSCNHPNTVVLMVGGLGSRLGELTSNCPKPLLKVGGRPVLETIVMNLRDQGFSDFVFCVNYRAEMIKDYFGNGEALGVSIRYVCEDKRMGTAGALALLPDEVSGPLLVMNGDIITKVNFGQLLDFHKNKEVVATMGIRKFDFQIPFGVVQTTDHDGLITKIEEKPVQIFQVNAGIYVIEKSCLLSLPHNNFFDMPQLFEKLIFEGEKTQAFPIHEYWLDIGREDDLLRAQLEFNGTEG